MKTTLHVLVAVVAVGLFVDLADAGLVIVDTVFNDSIVGTGQQSSYDITVKTIDSMWANYQVYGIEYYITQPLGTAFGGVSGMTSFTSTGIENYRTYLPESFLADKPVDVSSAFWGVGGAYIATPINQNLPFGTDGKAARYFFTAGNTLGVYQLYVSFAVLYYIGGADGFLGAELGIGTFEIRQWGDANGDGSVNLSDLQILGDNWQSTTADWTTADFNGDGLVNLSDLQIIGDNWGYGTSTDESFEQALQIVNVPESCTLGLIALSLISVGISRRNNAA